MDVRIPVIVGASEVVQRPQGRNVAPDALGPIELMEAACRRADAESGGRSLLTEVDWIGVAGGLWHFADPGRPLGDRLACTARTALASMSGSAPVELLGRAAALIADGSADIALVTGGEARWTSQRCKTLGIELPWRRRGGAGLVGRRRGGAGLPWRRRGGAGLVGRPGDEPLSEGDEAPEILPGLSEATLAEYTVVGDPAAAYALLEDARRVHLQRSVAQHRDEIAELWQRFSAVAAGHPWAWDRVEHSAAEIREATPDNRMIAFPYTKAMVANNTVDMASAIVVTSTATAQAAGIPRERWVFPTVVATARESASMLARPELWRATALERCGRLITRHTGVTIDSVDHVDLYACFPSVVQMSAEALGLGLGRQLTITGGLGFAGAPIGNGAGQALAAMVARLREQRGIGLVHGNGGNATKHALAMLAADPPPAPFAVLDVPDDDRQHPVAPPGWSGRATVDAATMIFGREGPTGVLAIGTSPQGRMWIRSTATDVIDAVIDAVLGGGLAGAVVDVEAGQLQVGATS